MKKSSMLENVKRLFFVFVLFVQANIAYSMDMAITVDDLPVHGDLPPYVSRKDIADQMVAAFKKHHINGVYGFVIGGRVAEWFLVRQIENIYNTVTGKNLGNWITLQKWVDGGQLLGNHTFSHLDLTKVTADEYIADIKENEGILAKIMGDKNYKYFRYPFLSEGDTLEKRNRVRDFLFQNQYQIAQTTVGFSDHKWNMAYVRCAIRHDNKPIEWLKKSFIEQALNATRISHLLSGALFHRDIKNVLLLHFGPFEAMMMDDLLTAYEKQGVRFISLPEALSDKLYRSNPNFVSKLGIGFLEQVETARQVGEPSKARQLLATLPLKQLDSLCQE